MAKATHMAKSTRGGEHASRAAVTEKACAPRRRSVARACPIEVDFCRKVMLSYGQGIDGRAQRSRRDPAVGELFAARHLLTDLFLSQLPTQLLAGNSYADSHLIFVATWSCTVVDLC